MFGLTPEYVSELRGRARKEGSAGLVKAMGRPPMLSPRQVAKVRELAAQGATQTALARQFKVSRPVIADVLPRHGVTAAQPPLADDLPDCADLPDGADPGKGQDQGPDAGLALAPAVPDPVEPGTAEPAPVVERGSGRIRTGTVACRYAGVMLAHAFLDRVGAEGVFSSLQVRRPGRAGPVVFDDVALLCATTLAFGLGTSCVEGAKHLNRAQAGALAGLGMLPELRTLRPRLAAIADAGDPLAAQRSLAAAMLAADAPAQGLYFVDDHFVPYAGAKPFAKGWNTKRKAAMPGRADTLLTDLRGRAVAFLTGEPAGLSKTQASGSLGLDLR